MQVCFHALRGNPVNVDEFVVVAVDEAPVDVEHVGEAAGHAGAEVDARTAEHDDDAAGHVFTAMVARAFDHGDCTRIAHGEALAGLAVCIQFTAGRAIQAGIVHTR